MRQDKNHQPKIKKISLPKIKLPHVPLVTKLAANHTIRAAGAFVLSALLVATLGWWAWSNSSLAKLSVRTTVVDGSVEFRLAHDDPWERVQAGMSFGEGAQLRTSDGARAAFTISDGSIVRLNAGSSVIFTKLTAQHIIVENSGGDVYSRVAMSNKRIFQVRAGATTYQSEGTAYRTFYTDAKEGVEVYHGQIGTQSGGTVTVGQGKRYYVTNSNTPDLEGRITDIPQAELSTDEFLRWNSDQDRRHFAHELGVLADITPPTLEITEPSDGFITTETSITVRGTAEPDAVVLVNNVGIANTAGAFERTINLDLGENIITATATDKAGNQTAKTVRVTRTEPIIFSLSGTQSEKGVLLQWNVSGVDASHGFRLLRDKGANPTYDKKKANVALDESERSYTWPILDGQTYHFRICIFDGETCTRYSNDVTVAAPHKVSGWSSWRN